MKLQEILNKATPRPWRTRRIEESLGPRHPEHRGAYYDIETPTYIICSMIDIDNAKEDAALIVRAVDNFEPLLEACNRTLLSAAFALMHADDRKFIKETIHRARVG